MATTAIEFGLPWPLPKDPAALKRAYRAAMLQHHPDRGGATGDAERINRWYACAQAILDGRFARTLPVPRQVVIDLVGFPGFDPWSGAVTANATSSGVGFAWGVINVILDP